MRPQLCHEALRIGRVLASIAPHEPEAHGLLALMELNASRTAARTDAAGEPILLLEQNRGLWDQLQIRRGLQALGRARALGGAGGFYALQAAIIACHAEAATADETDWPRISGLYAELARLVRSPVIELNRAVAVGMAEGPQAATRDRGPPGARARAQELSPARKVSAATCFTSSAALRKPAPRSKRQPAWRATSANMTC